MVECWVKGLLCARYAEGVAREEQGELEAGLGQLSAKGAAIHEAARRARARQRVEQQFMVLEETAFSSADRNKTVEIKDDEVKVDGVVRTVQWGDAKHADCTGKILSVDTKLKGKVKLVDGSEFENPAGGGELGQHPKELQV